MFSFPVTLLHVHVLNFTDLTNYANKEVKSWLFFTVHYSGIPFWKLLNKMLWKFYNNELYVTPLPIHITYLQLTLMIASCWIMGGLLVRFPIVSRPGLLTMPAVTVFWRLKGLPRATTHSPGRTSLLLPRGRVGRLFWKKIFTSLFTFYSNILSKIYMCQSRGENSN